MELRAGDPETIGGYALEARLGAGGMGTVFLAHSPSGRPVAIKLIHAQFLDDDEFRARFRQEVAAARRVSGAFTAAVVDADPDGEHPWMATTYIPGPTLAERIAEDGALRGAELRMLAIGLVEALRDIHRAGVVHRDLKPSNVVLSPDGPRVIDFGISRAADQKTLTMTGRIIGTPPFMSPEQLQTPREVGTASDVFSVATLLVYAATGQGPFDADSPYLTAYQVVHEQPVLGEMPEALRAVVEPCLDKDRGRRPDADGLLRQLRALPEDLGPDRPAQPAPDGWPGPGGRPEPARLPQPRTAPDPAGPTTHLSPGRSGGSAAPGPDDTGTRTPRSPGTARHRRRTAVAVAAAVAAIVTGVTLAVGGGKDSAARTGNRPDHGGTVTSAATVPSGFKPWKTTLRGGGKITDEERCVPDGDSVYCGGGGVVAARIRTADGTQVWRTTSPGVPEQGRYFVGVADGTAIGYHRPDGTDTSSWQLDAVATADGRQRWSAPFADVGAVFTGEAMDVVLLKSAVLSTDPAGTRIEARDVRTGRMRWTARFPAGSECLPVAAGDHAWAMCAPSAEVAATNVTHLSLHTLDPATGALGRAAPVTGPLRPMGADRSGALIALTEHRAGDGFDGYARVVRVDPRTGRATSAPVQRYAGATPGLADGTLYFAGDDGEVAAVDPDTGRRLWTAQTTVEGASAPAAARGVLYFGSASGRVVALDERSGRVRWSTFPQTGAAGGGTAGVEPRVAVAGGVLVTTAVGNTVFAFDAAKPPKAS